MCPWRASVPTTRTGEFEHPPHTLPSLKLPMAAEGAPKPSWQHLQPTRPFASRALLLSPSAPAHPNGHPPAAGGAESGAPRAGMLRGNHTEQEGGSGYLRSVLARRAEGTGSPRAGGLRVHPLFPWQTKNGERLSAMAAGKGCSGCAWLQRSMHPKNPSDNPEASGPAHPTLL